MRGRAAWCTAHTPVRVCSDLSPAQGEHLLHVLNTISSRKLVLEAELKEIDEDIAQNESMARKYGAEFFTEGSSRLAQSRVRASTPRAVQHSSCLVRRYLPPSTPSPGLSRSQADKQQKLAEIEQQLAETNTSVRQGKQLLGALAENYGNMVRAACCSGLTGGVRTLTTDMRVCCVHAAGAADIPRSEPNACCGWSFVHAAVHAGSLITGQPGPRTDNKPHLGRPTRLKARSGCTFRMRGAAHHAQLVCRLQQVGGVYR